jgi:hypothetical protein
MSNWLNFAPWHHRYQLFANFQPRSTLPPQLKPFALKESKLETEVYHCSLAEGHSIPSAIL